MPERLFRFKQFSIIQQKSAMKIGTDGVLLGAWANVPQTGEVLDIGSGTGLLSLMLAQRCKSHITAVEIDKDAYEESLHNFSNSKWNDRIEAFNTDVMQFSVSKTFTLIVCNPPFFTDSLKAPDLQRSLARHDDSLSLENLFTIVRKLLHSEGAFCVIYPFKKHEVLIQFAKSNNMYCNRICFIKPKPESEPVRILTEFGFTDKPKEQTSITIEQAERHQFTDEYKNLTSDFYLKF